MIVEIEVVVRVETVVVVIVVGAWPGGVVVLVTGQVVKVVWTLYSGHVSLCMNFIGTICLHLGSSSVNNWC